MCVRSDCEPGTVGLINYYRDWYFNGAPVIDECIECQYQVFGWADCGIDWTSNDYYVCNTCTPGTKFYDYIGTDYNDWCEADTSRCTGYGI